jgi:hypothetical protein
VNLPVDFHSAPFRDGDGRTGRQFQKYLRRASWSCEGVALEVRAMVMADLKAAMRTRKFCRGFVLTAGEKLFAWPARKAHFPTA